MTIKDIIFITEEIKESKSILILFFALIPNHSI